MEYLLKFFVYIIGWVICGFYFKYLKILYDNKKFFLLGGFIFGYFHIIIGFSDLLTSLGL